MIGFYCDKSFSTGGSNQVEQGMGNLKHDIIIDCKMLQNRDGKEI